MLSTMSPVTAGHFNLYRWSDSVKEPHTHIAPEFHQLVVELSPFPGADSDGSLQVSHAPDQAPQHLSLVNAARADGVLQGFHLPCMHDATIRY